MRRGAIGGLIVFACWLAGCNDFSQHRFGGVRDNFKESRPTPAPALAIANAPSTSRPQIDQDVKPAAYVPPSEPAAYVPPSEVAPPPSVPTDAGGQLLQHPMRLLYQRAAQRHATMDSYIFQFTKREVAGGAKQPEELILVKLRREPYSVCLKWLGNEGKGRETIYVQGKFDNKMQVLLAPGDPFALFMGGKWMPVSPDDAMVKAKSRYPITGTGFGSLIDRYGQMVAGIERGEPREGKAKYLGLVKREEFEQKVEAVHQILPANAEANLPMGGERWWFFDASHGLPVLVVTHDATGEVEYYCHRQIQFQVRLEDDDFNPQGRRK